MDFNLNEEQKAIQAMVKEFAKNEVEPIAAEIDKTMEFPIENVRKMGKIGLMGMMVPKEYGGAGAGAVGYVTAIEEISKVCASTGVIMSVNNSLACYPLQTFGTEEQKQKFLKPIASGEKLGAFGLTEPSAGTDAGSQASTAVLDGDHYVLNGSKVFITNGCDADTFIVFAMTDKSKGMRGISAFVLEKGTPGFTLGKYEDKLGIRASGQVELFFSDCRIPKENLIGKVGAGFKIAMMTLDGGRIGIAAQAVGIAQAAMEESIKYAKERVQFGRPIATKQAIQWMIADMATKIEASRLLLHRAAAVKDAGKRYSYEAAMAKLVASETAMEVTTKAIQIHGGYGYTKDYAVERFFRDAKITEIYEGTSEVQRMVISGTLLK
jgi:butyryl-CoA dehydrogenase